jgi:hypothetical protein
MNMAAAGKAIDDLMEQASEALALTHYFEAERIAAKALDRACAALDFERMARICMPLQEARRQKRHEATDGGITFALRTLPTRGGELAQGCYLLTPPLIGIEGQTLRNMLDRKKIPALVVCKEPTTSSGKWPLVGVSGTDRESLVIRVQVPPPEGFENLTSNGPSNGPGDGLRPGPSPRWFLASLEAMGDAAIAKVDPKLPPDYRALDLYEYLKAVPDHEKLHQALEAACREAAVAGPSPRPRRRAVIDDPFSF